MRWKLKQVFFGCIFCQNSVYKNINYLNSLVKMHGSISNDLTRSSSRLSSSLSSATKCSQHYLKRNWKIGRGGGGCNWPETSFHWYASALLFFLLNHSRILLVFDFRFSMSIAQIIKGQGHAANTRVRGSGCALCNFSSCLLFIRRLLRGC